MKPEQENAIPWGGDLNRTFVPKTWKNMFLQIK
jgi:hypothetical protein